jgi:hypothetical protein
MNVYIFIPNRDTFQLMEFIYGYYDYDGVTPFVDQKIIRFAPFSKKNYSRVKRLCNDGNKTIYDIGNKFKLPIYTRVINHIKDDMYETGGGFWIEDKLIMNYLYDFSEANNLRNHLFLISR